MSFTKTISTVAALASIFGAGAAGWKLAQDSKEPNTLNLEEKITKLEKQLEQATKAPVVTQTPLMSAPTLPPPVVQTATEQPNPATVPGTEPSTNQQEQ